MTKTWETEYLLLGNTFQGVKKAIELDGQNKKVMLASWETYLAGDICGTFRYKREEIPEGFFPESCMEGEHLHPDRCKRYLEDRCLEAGVRFYYGLYYLDQRRVKGRFLVRFASKGGIYRVLCDGVWNGPSPGPQNGISLRAWVREAGTEKNRLLEVFCKEVPEISRAEALLLMKKQLLYCFRQEQQKNPGLRLGRFADRITGYDNDKKAGAADKGFSGGLPQQVDVIVAGGGTSGAMAALYAARGGADTLLLEPLHDLGGTAAAGGVSAYWFGMRFREVREVNEAVEKLCSQCAAERDPGTFDRYDAFPPGFQSMAVLKLCLEAGVRVVLGQLVYDVIRENGRVTGVKTAGEAGKRSFYGKLVIDATGDGDLAAAAGAAMQYGSEEEGFTYWASLAQYTGVDSYQNNFSSMVRLDDAEDLTRFIYTGRRRGENTFDHGSYVSTRESRHIRGEKTIDLRDLCLYRTYEDGLYTCFSNYDPKGRTDADMVFCGFLPPQVRIQVPLGALLPVDKQGKRISGLYVAGKAISATHNVFPSLRMQADLMHQGAVLGLLAAKAAGAGMEIEALSREDRQKWIREITGDDLKLETESTFGSLKEAVEQIKADSRTHWIDAPFTYEEKRHSPILWTVCADSQTALPLLQQRRKEAGGDSGLLLMLERLALFHGGDDAKETEEHIRKELCKADPYLPLRRGPVTCAQLLPDHGVMPETVCDMNLLSHSRGFSMEPYRIVTERLSRMERDYLTIEKGIFSYMEGIAYAAEKSGRKEFIPLLRELASFPEFAEAFLPEKETELMSERMQMLWIVIHKALLLLGCPEGKEGLLEAEKSRSLSIRLAVEKALVKNRSKKGNGEGAGEKGKKRW